MMAISETPVPEAAASVVGVDRTEEPGGNSRWREWDLFVAATPAAGFMQTSWWADFRATVGFAPFGLTLRADNSVVGGAMVQRFRQPGGTMFYYVQEGPVLPDDEEAAADVFAAILASVDAERLREAAPVSHLRIEPRWDRLPAFVTGFTAPPQHDGFAEPRNTLCVHLQPHEEAILAQMKPKGRYNIRLAQRLGVRVVEDTSPRGFDDFLAIYYSTGERQGFSLKPSGYFESLLAALRTHGAGALFFAEHGGARLATALVIWCGDRATYFYGGSLAEDRRVMAPYLLHFEIMRRARARGYAWYDFWGIAPVDDADSPWARFSVFKRKFGGVDVRLVPTLDLVYDAAAYARHLAARRAVRRVAPVPLVL